MAGEDNQVNVISEGNSEDSNSKRRFFTTRNVVILGVIGLVFVVVFAVLYYLLFVSKFNSVEEEKISQKTTVGTSSVTIELDEVNESKHGGLVTLTQIDGKTSVLIGLDAVLAAEEQPVNIYKGSCPSPGNDIEYKLNKIVYGRSETILKDDVEKINSKKPLAIVVHKSFEEEKINVSCADIK